MATEQRDLVLRKYLRAKNYVQPWHKNIGHWRNLYDFEHYQTQGKKGETQYTDPTYTNVVDLAVGILLKNEMSWHAFGWRPSFSEEENTSKIEKYLAGVLGINNERNQYLIPYEVILNFVRDGAACLYTVWDSELHEQFFLPGIPIQAPEEPSGVKEVPAFMDIPLRVYAIDPKKMYVLPGSYGRWRCMIRAESKSVLDIEEEYGITPAQHKDKSYEQKQAHMSDLVDYWGFAPGDYNRSDPLSEEEMEYEAKVGNLVVYNGVLYDGEFIPGLEYRYMDGYLDLPYTVGFYKPVDREDPNQWHGIIRPLEATIPLMERMVNRRTKQIDTFSSLPMIAKTLPGRVVSMDPGLGNLISLDPTEDIGFPEWRGDPPDVDKQMGYFQSKIHQSGFAEMMMGDTSGDPSGYALSQIGDQNKIRLEQPVQHLQLFWSTWAKKVLNLSTEMAGNALIRVYGKVRGRDFSEQVTGDDLFGYRVRAEIHPEFPNEKARKHAMATQAGAWLSPQTIMERYLDIEQPDEERVKQLMAQVQAHPAYMNYAIMRELKEMADDGDEIAAQTLMMMMQGSMAGAQPGRPTEPRNPEQMMGMQSPTGEPTPQEQGGEPPGRSMEEIINAAANRTPGLMGE